MELLKDENAVSEVVGAMLVLLILVVYLGILQAYEVPKWNKELEEQQFDIAYGDFLDMRSNLEDVTSKNIPKTSSIHMGVMYPRRFLLSNPGQGAYGNFSTYPLNVSVNISYYYSGNISYKTYSYNTAGLVYQLNGISTTFPKLVYENGLFIKDYGIVSFPVDEIPSLASEDNVFIPIISYGANEAYSLEEETFSLFPLSQKNSNKQKFLVMNLTIDTQYPEIWAGLSNISIPPGAGFSVDKVNKKIRIMNIPGYNTKRVNLPDNGFIQASKNRIDAGMITIDNSIMKDRGPTGPDGQDFMSLGQGRIGIPASIGSSEFIIGDIAALNKEKKDKPELGFVVTDITNGNKWEVNIQFKFTGGVLKIDSFDSAPSCSQPLLVSGELNLTSCYMSAGIGSTNVLNIENMAHGLYYFNVIIN
jgi:hypothetical protein